MVRSKQSQLTRPPGTLRADLLAIIRAAIGGASAGDALFRALADPQFSRALSVPISVVAAGKAAGSMCAALARANHLHIRSIVAAGTHRAGGLSPTVEWYEAAHPLPDERSVAAARRALQIASLVGRDETLLILLSGGASALMALPAEGVTLDEKRHTIRTMMHAGADIHALNTVRKHVSAIKGGRLAAGCAGTTLTFAVSDVIGDDVSVIGSGPGVADASTWADAARALAQFGGAQHPASVRQLIERGTQELVPDTPKPGAPALARAHAHVIASRQHALAAARTAAEALGYAVVLLPGDVAGEAREVAARWFREALAAASGDRAICVLSGGETTVRVTGQGRGGRNQEFVLALTEAVADSPRHVLVASVGTDGIDGPTDAAGALVDRTTRDRATMLGLDANTILADNNAYDFFAMLGDLIHLGRTDTNVGDVQVLIAAPDAP